METFRKGFNFCYFYRRRIGIATGFCLTYGYVCKKATTAKNENYRMAIAGSIAGLLCETTFHLADTVNVRAKVSEKNHSSFKMVKKIYAKEGIKGFFKGFSANFYGSIMCGFIYFACYKSLKTYFSNLLGPTYNVAWTFFLASIIAEGVTLVVYYPYDLIKCRL